MVAVDTNVLLRYLFHADDPAQGALAVSLIDGSASRGEPVFVSTLVLCELVWTLKSAFRLDRAEVLAILQEILARSIDEERALFELEDEGLLAGAIDDFAKGKADFADYVIGRIGESAGAAPTWTFDRVASGITTFKRLTASAIE